MKINALIHLKRTWELALPYILHGRFPYLNFTLPFPSTHSVVSTLLIIKKRQLICWRNHMKQTVSNMIWVNCWNCWSNKLVIFILILQETKMLFSRKTTVKQSALWRSTVKGVTVFPTLVFSTEAICSLLRINSVIQRTSASTPTTDYNAAKSANQIALMSSTSSASLWIFHFTLMQI